MFRTIKLVAGGLVLSGALLLPSGIAFAQNQAPDNTAANKQDRDRSTSPPTADQATNNLSDREMSAHIRRDIVHDKSLSTYAHNVKVIARDGKVTLRGPVRSEDEKRAIEDHARKYAGDNVDDQLTVKPEHQ